ncbi:MAG: response regulator transcription factor [Dehalococcoidales bacterium]|nr:response regulator transcription factor [Dehalococcoidales bacterium]
MDKLRLLIADDHVIVREGLRAILEAQPDIEVVGEAANGEEAVDKTRELKPDVILMDITMPGMGGLEATRQIKKSHPEVKVLALTMHESDEYFFKMLESGASGYFIKGGSSSELIVALRAVWKGDVFLYPTMAKKLLSDYLQRVKSGQDRESYDGLTNREREILRIIAEGHTNQEIADLLVLSVATVQTHRAHIMSKLGLRHPAELIKYAIRHGFITVDT